MNAEGRALGVGGISAGPEVMRFGAGRLPLPVVWPARHGSGYSGLAQGLPRSQSLVQNADWGRSLEALDAS